MTFFCGLMFSQAVRKNEKDDFKGPIHSKLNCALLIDEPCTIYELFYYTH